MNPKLSSKWWVTTVNRILIGKCILDFSSPCPWTHKVLRVAYPRILRTGTDCRVQGKVKYTDKPRKRGISSKDGHNTATQPHSYACYSATHATQLYSHAATQAPHAIHDSASEGRVTTLQEAVLKALSLGINENCMWNFARALKGFEEATGQIPELGAALSVWWAAAKLPASEQFDEYLWDLTTCFGKVKSVLGSSMLQTVEASLPPLPANPTPADRLERLKSLCAALQHHKGKRPFYLSYRDVSRIVGTKDPYTAKNMVMFLISKGVLKCVKTWTAGTRKANEYIYTP